jgi:hypothetical protein
MTTLMVTSGYLYRRDHGWAAAGRVPALQNLLIASKALSREKETYAEWSTQMRSTNGLGEAVGSGAVEPLVTVMA